MKPKYVHIKIDQTNTNEFDMHLEGNSEDMFKALAGAVAQTVLSAPERYQQHCRTRFLQYLNQVTIEGHMEEL